MAVASAVYLAGRGQWAPDLGAVYFGAKAFGLGEIGSVYAAPPLLFGNLIEDPVWLSMADGQGLTDLPLLPFVYQPLVAAAVAPFTARTSAMAFLEVGRLIELFALCLAILGARSLAGRPLSPALWVVASLGVCLPTTALQNALFHAQPQIIVVALVILAFWLYRGGRDISAGLVLTLAGAIKLAPLFLRIVFLADRRWAAALTTALASFALGAAGFWLAGPDLHLAFLDQIRRAGSMHLLSPLVYSGEGALTALWALLQGAPAELVAGKAFAQLPSVGWIKAVSYSLLFLGSLAILWLSRKRPPEQALATRLLGIWSLLAILGPLAWAHYALGPILLMPTLFGLMPPRRAFAIAVPVVAGLSLPSGWLDIWLLPGLSLGTLAGILSLLALAFLPTLLTTQKDTSAHDD